MLKGVTDLQYLDSFTLPTRDREEQFLMFSHNHKLEMSCYSNSPYPFGIFPEKKLRRIDFEPITVFCGSNGSGKSTLLNVIAEKLSVPRSAPFNKTPLYEEYLRFCEADLRFGTRLPKGSMIITSDDVFDYLLDIRAVNEGVDNRREDLFEEYNGFTDPKAPRFQMSSLEDYDELKKRNLARNRTKSKYVSAQVKREIRTRSNGESAFLYFTDRIRENALYLLDEPENSLSAPLQLELAEFIENSARFYGCQFIISSHSPFMLAMKDAAIYDLDRTPAERVRWTDIENVRIYHKFFEKHRDDFGR